MEQALSSSSEPLDVARVHADHAAFVWRVLYRLGVRESDLEDMLQEVFLVVHRRRDSHDGQSRLTTWLFGICLRVASDYRRRAHRRRETLPGEDLEGMVAAQSSTEESPEEHVARKQAKVQLEAILDTMDMEKRAVFVMFELEKQSCAEIATLMEIPVGTVYSRLHAARKAFTEALTALQQKLQGGSR